MRIVFSSLAFAGGMPDQLRSKLYRYSASANGAGLPPLKKGADSAQRWRGDLLLTRADTGQPSALDFRPTSFAAIIPASYSRHIGIASISCDTASGGVITAATTTMPISA